MKRTVLVSGASGIVGYGILRGLRKARPGLCLVGTSIYEDSVAQGFCDVFEVAIRTSEPGYLDWLSRTVKARRVDLAIPGIEDDVFRWSESAEEIARTGAKAVLNSTGLIQACKDKWTFYQELVRMAPAYAIDTSLIADFATLAEKYGVPFLLKPRRGFASKGIVRVHDSGVFASHKDKIGTILMAQPIIGDERHEYTCAAFGDGSGGFSARMALRRELSKDGFTEKAEVVAGEEFDDALSALCRCFKPMGPTNFQFRSAADGLKLLEINPRISSSTSIRTAFGYNEAEMSVRYFLDGELPSQPEIGRGKAVRYVDDFIFR